MPSKLAVVEKGSARKDHSSRIKAACLPLSTFNAANKFRVRLFTGAHSAVALIKSEEVSLFFRDSSQNMRNLLRDDTTRQTRVRMRYSHVNERKEGRILVGLNRVRARDFWVRKK